MAEAYRLISCHSVKFATTGGHKRQGLLGANAIKHSYNQKQNSSFKKRVKRGRLTMRTAAILLSLTLLAACNEQQRKADLFNLEPGMTFVESQDAILNNGYNCRTSPHRAYTECVIKEVKVTIYYSKQLDGNPVVAIAADLSGGGSLSETAKSIAAQYAVPIGTSDSKGNYDWTVGKAYRLRFTGMLVLTDPELTKRDDAAD